MTQLIPNVGERCSGLNQERSIGVSERMNCYSAKARRFERLMPDTLAEPGIVKRPPAGAQVTRLLNPANGIETDAA